MSLIEVSKITKNYGKKQVLRDITFSAEAGECIGIVGANGCGKSTLLKILSGAHKPDGGSISYNNENPLQLGFLQIRGIRAAGESSVR